MNKQKATLLLVDDDENIKELFELIMGDDYNLLSVQNAADAVATVNEYKVNAVLLDLKLPDGSGLEVLRRIKKSNPEIEVVIITGYASLETAVESMRLGAFDYITKPINVNELRPLIDRLLEHQNLRREVVYLRSIITNLEEREQIVSQSVKMEQIYRTIPKIAASDVNVYIQGEPGTGKELTARMIHRESERSLFPFVVFDCSAVEPEELEKELYSYSPNGDGDLDEREKVGCLELAGNGTVFFDEVGLLPISVQKKLLAVLESGKFERLGDGRSFSVNCRIISSSKYDLSRQVSKGLFLKNLFYLLNDIPITIPALKERKEDIPILIKCFLDCFNRSLKKNILDVEKEALEVLINYNWPGNVRELKNVVERMVTLEDRNILTSKYLPLEIIICQDVIEYEINKRRFNYMDMVDNFRKIIVMKALSQTGGNQTKASEILGVHRNTVVGIVRKYKLITKQSGKI